MERSSGAWAAAPTASTNRDGALAGPIRLRQREEMPPPELPLRLLEGWWGGDHLHFGDNELISRPGSFKRQKYLLMLLGLIHRSHRVQPSPLFSPNSLLSGGK